MTSSVITRRPRRCASCDQPADVLERAEGRVDRAVVGNVVAVVAQRRGVERQQPDRRDAQLLDVVELLDQAVEIADAVAVGVEERLDVGLVDHRVLVPVRPAAGHLVYRGDAADRKVVGHFGLHIHGRKGSLGLVRVQRSSIRQHDEPTRNVPPDNSAQGAWRPARGVLCPSRRKFIARQKAGNGTTRIVNISSRPRSCRR